MNETQSNQSNPPTPTALLTSKQKLRAWLELSRISNLPTVWSNVLVGVAIATVADSGEVQFFSSTVSPLGVADNIWTMLQLSVVPMIAISMFYIGGMMLNDVFDLPVDRQERPCRPLPSGRVSVRAANGAISAMFLIGWLMLNAWAARETTGSPMLVWSTALISSIVLYNYFHKRYAASIVFMGASRSLVYITAACTLYWPLSPTHQVWWLAVVLGLYTIGITVIARGETQGRIDQRKWLAPVMLLVVVAMVAQVRPSRFGASLEFEAAAWVGVAAIALSAWLVPTIHYVFAKPPKTVKAILTWLSGICLVDAYFLTLLGQPVLALIAGGCFLLTAWGHRHILGT